MAVIRGRQGGVCLTWRVAPARAGLKAATLPNMLLFLHCSSLWAECALLNRRGAAWELGPWRTAAPEW